MRIVLPFIGVPELWLAAIRWNCTERKRPAKEAVKGIGFDVLIVCGFAFDLAVSEEAKRYGKLVVLPTKMNPDVAMGDELLKKTGAANRFMVCAEPDVG